MGAVPVGEKGIRIRYPFIVEQVQEEDGSAYWVAEVPDLPGCAAHGRTLEELAQALAGAIEDWIALAQERGVPIPEPSLEEHYSGKLMLRMPPSLHRRLALLAKRNNVSLNTQILNLLYHNYATTPVRSVSVFIYSNYSAAPHRRVVAQPLWSDSGAVAEYPRIRTCAVME